MSRLFDEDDDLLAPKPSAKPAAPALARLKEAARGFAIAVALSEGACDSSTGTADGGNKQMQAPMVPPSPDGGSRVDAPIIAPMAPPVQPPMIPPMPQPAADAAVAARADAAPDTPVVAPMPPPPPRDAAAIDSRPDLPIIAPMPPPPMPAPMPAPMPLPAPKRSE